MVKLKDIFNPAVNKNTKQVSFCLKKKLVKKKGINMKEVMEMELNNDDFFK